MKKTKIIATIGPACCSEEMVLRLINSGVNVFRLNFSHGSHKEHGEYIKTIKKVRTKLNKNIAILADLQGPKIRIGKHESILKHNQKVTLSCSVPGENEVPVQYKNLAKDVKAGDILLLDDGKLELKVLKVNGPKIFTQVLVGGKLSSNKGINLPTGTITASVITTKDKNDARFALENGVDFLALSFVKNEKDINNLRKVIKSSKNPNVNIIAKIERHEALLALDKILEATDGVMVARGDLGIELPSQDVPIIQKKITKKALALGKPCIVATQMLESMIENPRSTRAETSDIANAILDGADAVMLSAETSVGKYPLNAVKAMKAVALQTEEWMERDNIIIGSRIVHDNSKVGEAIARAGVNISSHVDAEYILTATASGNTARAVAKYRSHKNVIAVTANKQVACQLSLSWGVEAIVLHYVNDLDLISKVNNWLKQEKNLKKGSLITVISGITKGLVGGTNLIRIHKID